MRRISTFRAKALRLELLTSKFLVLRDRSLNMARGGDGEETRNFEKNVGAPLKNYMPFQGPPYAFHTF